LSDSEPEPDLAVVSGPERTYAKRYPLPRDSAQLIEIADTTLARNRSAKGPLYARSRIAVYWIINLQQAKVEVYTEPRGGKLPCYRQRRDYGKGEAVPLVLAGIELGILAVRNLVP
jgi:Uma2 family endonuclease